MQEQIKKITIAIAKVEDGSYFYSKLVQGALYSASYGHNTQIIPNVSDAVFDRLNETIKTSVKNPEADARAILTPDNILTPRQIVTTAETLYNKYKPVEDPIGEGGAVVGPIGDGGAVVGPIGEGGAGGAERLQGLFGAAYTNTQLAFRRWQILLGAAYTRLNDSSVLKAIAARANKRKRDQA